MPALNLIQSFRGVVDFYYWKGQACARAWPKLPVPTPTPALARTHDALRTMHAWLNARPTSWHTDFAGLNTEPGFSILDMRRKIALTLAYAGATQTPPVISEILTAIRTPPMRSAAMIITDEIIGSKPLPTFWRIYRPPDPSLPVPYGRSMAPCRRYLPSRTRPSPSWGAFGPPANQWHFPGTGIYTVEWLEYETPTWIIPELDTVSHGLIPNHAPVMLSPPP